MKTYVITLSRVFPVTHHKKGTPTNFSENLRKQKIHTIRANYPLWKKRFDEIERGEAALSVREWTGRPYNSKQREIVRLTKENGIGIQRLQFHTDGDGVCLFSDYFFDIDGRYAKINDLAENDGLSLSDWRAWFKNYDFSQPLAIIHFTDFRY